MRRKYISLLLALALVLSLAACVTAEQEPAPEPTPSLPADFALKAWIQVGDADQNVPYTQSVNFAERLAEQIGEENVSFSILEGTAHEDDAFYTDANLAAVLAFLDGVMK